MKAFIALFLSAWLANSLMADPYSAAIQRAKNVSGRVTAANQQLDAQPPAPAPAQGAPPSSPALQATLQNIESLKNDMAAISATTNPAALTTAKQSLSNDLAAAAQGAKPSTLAVSKMTDELAAVINGNEKLRPQLPRLAQFSHAVFNAAHLTDAQQQTIFDGVQKMLAEAGVPDADATGVAGDFKAIANETK